MQEAQETWLGRSPRAGNGNPLPDSCLGNPMDRGAWRATVHGVAEWDTTAHTHTHTHTHTRMRAHTRCWKVSERRLLRTHSSVHTHTHTHTRARCWKGSERRLLRTHSSVAVGRRPPGIFWDYVNKISAASPGITVYMRMGRTHPKDREETCFPAAAPPSLQFSLGSPIPPLSLSIGIAPG